jgi:hypothetical protein
MEKKKEENKKKILKDKCLFLLISTSKFPKSSFSAASPIAL